MKLSLPGQRVAQKMALRSRDHLRQRQQPKGKVVGGEVGGDTTERSVEIAE